MSQYTIINRTEPLGTVIKLCVVRGSETCNDGVARFDHITKIRVYVISYLNPEKKKDKRGVTPSRGQRFTSLHDIISQKTCVFITELFCWITVMKLKHCYTARKRMIHFHRWVSTERKVMLLEQYFKQKFIVSNTSLLRYTRVRGN